MKAIIVLAVIILMALVIKTVGVDKLGQNVRIPLKSPLATATNMPFATPTDDLVNQLGFAGESYLDTQNRFNFVYFSDYTIDHEGNGSQTRITKIGKTQKGQTEIYDGVIMFFDPVEIGNQSLSEYLDRKIATSTEDGTTQMLQAKSPYSINGYNGFIYVTRGLGEHTTYVLQKDRGSKYALEITTMVADPGNVGYQKEVDAILQTVKLLK